MAFKPTLLAPKLNLRRAITSLNMSALATFLRSVARVNKPDFHTSSFSFVGNKGLELSKAQSSETELMQLGLWGEVVGEWFFAYIESSSYITRLSAIFLYKSYLWKALHLAPPSSPATTEALVRTWGFQAGRLL